MAAEYDPEERRERESAVARARRRNLIYGNYKEAERHFERLAMSPEQERFINGSWRDVANQAETGGQVEELHISVVTNGFIVRAGCMIFVFDDAAKLAVELTRWTQNPHKVQAEYSKRYSSVGMATFGGLGAQAGVSDMDAESPSQAIPDPTARLNKY